MKVVKVVAVLVLMNAGAAWATDVHPHIKVLSNKMDIVYMKVSDELVGGSLTVYDGQGGIVLEIPVEGKKVLVDFYLQKPGDYVIHIEKSGHAEEIEYHKG
jgi:hypothetical protein